MALRIPGCFFLLAVLTAVLLAAPQGGPGAKQPPFPPGPPPEFKDILPPATFAQLTAIHQDSSLTNQQKIAKIDEIMNALPQEVLEKLPLPPVFRAFPADAQGKLKAVLTERGLGAQERGEKVREIIESLPPEQRQMLTQPVQLQLPPEPPVELRKVLPTKIWNELLAVYQNNSIGNEQKMQKIGQIMDALPDPIREKLPLPPPFRKLPPEVQEKLRAIHMEKGLTMEQRFQKTQKLIDSLPADVKKLLPPPPPRPVPSASK